MRIRTWAMLLCLGSLALAGCAPSRKGPAMAGDKPNFVVIFADDLGYGDLGCFGHPTLHTPNLDRMAAEGQKWTSFYVGASVCTPSRAALMTGRLPIRSGMCADSPRVLFPYSAGGIPDREVTIAEMLRDAGYATGMAGKWHLGHLPQYLPTSHGFDSYLGLPYSNDMDAVQALHKGKNVHWEPKNEYWNVPLIRGKEVVERPADQATLTKRYTEEAVRFIRANRDRPFFFYLAHTFPHVPLFAAGDWKGKSLRGLFGDVVEQVDWSVGQILDTLRELGLSKKTMVVFTSDNGPWLIFNQLGGSAGLLREGKGCTWEGGMRVPCVMWWPGSIKPGLVSGMGSTMDLFPTFAELAGGEVPADRVMDGKDLGPALFGDGPSPRTEMFFYRGESIWAARRGPYKAHYRTRPGYRDKTEEHSPPLLFHLEHDPSEKYDISKDHPDVIAAINQMVEAHRKTVKPVENQLKKKLK